MSETQTTSVRVNKATQDLWDRMKTDPSTPYRLVIKALLEQYKGTKVTEEMLEELGVRERLSDKEVVVKVDSELKTLISNMKVHRAQPDAEILAYITDHFAYDGKKPPSTPAKRTEEPEPTVSLKKPSEPQQPRQESTASAEAKASVERKVAPEDSEPPSSQSKSEEEDEEEDEEGGEEEEAIEFPTDAYKVKCPHCNAPLVITVSSLANAMTEEEGEREEEPDGEGEEGEDGEGEEGEEEEEE